MNELKKYSFANPDTTPVKIQRVWCIHTRVEIAGHVESTLLGWSVVNPLRKTGRAVYHSQKAVSQRSGKLQRSEAFRTNDYARIMGDAIKWERAQCRTAQRDSRRAKRLTTR